MNLDNLTENKFPFWIVGGLIFLGFFIYVVWGSLKFMDPNYMQFGPLFSFYTTKQCALNTDKSSSTVLDCPPLGSQSLKDIYKNNLPTISDSLKIVLPQISASGYTQDPSGWVCSVNGEMVNNNDQIVLTDQAQTYYYCWPR